MIMGQRRSACAVVVASLLLGGCSTALRDIGREPHMTPPGTGLIREQPYVKVAQPVPSRMLSTGSLWRDESADLFKDPRARRVGDTLKVEISIKDKASIDSTSDRSREASTDGNFDFNYNVLTSFLGGTGSGSGDASVDSGSKHKGEGATSRSETIELSIAAMVTHRLPNGNLVISGTQEIRVNYEVRELKVTGIVRPRDIASNNSIAYDKIAEARISYGGRGRIMEVQQPRWGQQLFDILTPF